MYDDNSPQYVGTEFISHITLTNFSCLFFYVANNCVMILDINLILNLDFDPWSLFQSSKKKSMDFQKAPEQLFVLLSL